MTLPLTALTLVVASSLGWSVFDLMRKILVRSIPPLPLLFLLTLGAVPCFALWWGVAGGAGPSSGYWLPAVGSVVLNVGANVAFILAISLAPLSVTIPLLSLLPVFTAVAAIPLLGEVPSPRQWAGILLVVAGAAWLSAGGGRWKSPGGFAAALLREKGSLLMVAVALFWACTVPLDKLAMRQASPSFHALFLVVGVAAAVLGILVLRGETAQLAAAARAPRRLVLAVVISATALGLQLLALPLVWVGLVETIKRGIGNVMALVFGRFLLREAVGWLQLLAVLLMAAGVGLILE